MNIRDLDMIIENSLYAFAQSEKKIVSAMK